MKNNKLELNKVYEMDVFEFLKKLDDQSIDLAIVDPPYGINYDAKAMKAAGQQYGVAAAKKKTYHTSNWDSKIPPKEYFDELFRVSKNQIIWGATTLQNI